MVMRWPDDLAAWIGRGNTSYALGDLAAAEAAFRLASTLHPGNATAWNNLAHVLGQNGRTEEAIAMARRALDLAEGDSGPYLDTLRELMRPRTSRKTPEPGYPIWPNGWTSAILEHALGPGWPWTGASTSTVIG